MAEPILNYTEIIYDPWQDYNFSKEFNRRFSRVLGEKTILDRDSFRIDVLSQVEKTILLHKGFCFKDRMFIQICDTEINLSEVLVDAEDEDMVLILLEYTYARKLEPNRASLRIVLKSQDHPLTFFNNFILVGCLTYKDGVLTPIYGDTIYIDLVDYIPITTITELGLIGIDPDYPLDGHYYLANDIDASQTRMWNWAGEYQNWDDYESYRRIYDFMGWLPIGITDWYITQYVFQTEEPTTHLIEEWFENAFTGILDGCGHTIYNLYSTYNSTGLFFATDGAVIKNLNLVNAYLHTRNYASHPVGGISARSKDTRFEQIYVSGNFKGGRTGGVVSHFYFSNNTPTEYSHYFENCHNDANIGSSRGSGGILAVVCDYDQSYVPAAEEFYLMKNCFSTGIIDSNLDVNDGLVGELQWSVHGNSTIHIDDCYHNCYYSNGVGGISSYREDDYLRQAATFLNWDFVYIWEIEEDISYPYFIWRNLRSITRTYSFDIVDDRINGGVVNFSGWKDDWDE